MNGRTKYAVGVDLGGTSIKLGLVSEEGKIIKKISIGTDAVKGSQSIIENIKLGIYDLQTKTNLGIDGIGIGCPGIVNPEKGTVENPPNFPGWKKVNLGKAISMEFEKDVFIENDANAAAIGELIFGNGIKFNSFIMVTLGTGVGGGIVINRKLYRGKFGAAGEIGHISIDHKGPKCKCGSRGCIEAYAGNSYLIERVKVKLKKQKNSIVNELIENNYELLSPKIIKEAADKGDEFSISVIEDLGIKLGAAFASLSNVLDISTYIIGGGVAGFGKPLFDSIKKSLTARVMTPLKPRVKILSAKLRNDAGIKGASALVFHGY
ncbi:MAG: ROK family protein [Ignavibacteriaceae bacterium]